MIWWILCNWPQKLWDVQTVTTFHMKHGQRIFICCMKFDNLMYSCIDHNAKRLSAFIWQTNIPLVHFHMVDVVSNKGEVSLHAFLCLNSSLRKGPRLTASSPRPGQQGFLFWIQYQSGAFLVQNNNNLHSNIIPVQYTVTTPSQFRRACVLFWFKNRPRSGQHVSCSASSTIPIQHSMLPV